MDEDKQKKPMSDPTPPVGVCRPFGHECPMYEEEARAERVERVLDGFDFRKIARIRAEARWLFSDLDQAKEEHLRATAKELLFRVLTLPPGHSTRTGGLEATHNTDGSLALRFVLVSTQEQCFKVFVTVGDRSTWRQPEKGDDWRTITESDSLYPFDTFVEKVDLGKITAEQGYGVYATMDRKHAHAVVDVAALPEDPPAPFTHVAWTRR